MASEVITRPPEPFDRAVNIKALPGGKTTSSKLPYLLKTSFLEVAFVPQTIKKGMAVVAAFFICWAPFHAQRLLAVYANSVKAEEKRKSLDQVYTVLTYLSGIFYYLSTTVNPVLYNIMSHKFREAFKSTLAQCCGRDKYSKRKRAYSVLSRCNNNHQQQHQPLCRAHPDWQPPRSPPGAAGGGGLPAAGAAAAPSSPAAAAAAAAGSLNHSYPQYRPRSRVSSDSSQLTLTTSVGLLSLASSTRRERGGCSLLRSYPSIGALARLLRGGAEPDQGRRAAAAAAAAAAADSTTNTISNSSLQDLDEAEFVGADLASYMGEVNELVALH
ncbi:alpha-1D adrenergic receptor-like [Bacillus rossius redtenbacheri]|uniref:alpha-1D adrenergic receptor-like n=1 Tax=Bacillus rossius redtenbacheri TaxID=93214 RepID=UPI002FDCBF46